MSKTYKKVKSFVVGKLLAAGEAVVTAFSRFLYGVGVLLTSATALGGIAFIYFGHASDSWGLMGGGVGFIALATYMGLELRRA